MTDAIASKLAAYGIDYIDAMDRMDDNPDLYQKLAFKYLNDENYVNLVAAMDVKDYDAAYKAAHALKGVSGNLSFNNLFKAAAAASDALFQGEYQAAEGFMPEIKAANEKVLAGLEAWQNGEL